MSKLHKKAVLQIFFIFGLFVLPHKSEAQNFSLKPIGISFDTYTYGMWEFNEGLTGQSLNELRLRGQLYFKTGISLFTENKTKYYKNKGTTNDFSQYYMQYSKSFSHKGWFPLFKYSSHILVKAGKIEWYPVFRDMRLISENLELFREPYSFYGVLLDVRMPFLKDRSLTARFNAHTKDLIEGDQEAQIRNAYLTYRKDFLKNFGIAMQVGKMEGSVHAVNFAYLYYKPKIEKIQLGFKAGKLLSLDDIPYGFEVRIERDFKFIALGAYYQRRIDQKSYFEEKGTDSQIFGFTWRFIGPKALKMIMDTYQLVYDTNTETLRFVIPILLTNLDFK